MSLFEKIRHGWRLGISPEGVPYFDDLDSHSAEGAYVTFQSGPGTEVDLEADTLAWTFRRAYYRPWRRLWRKTWFSEWVTDKPIEAVDGEVGWIRVTYDIGGPADESDIQIAGKWREGDWVGRITEVDDESV